MLQRIQTIFLTLSIIGMGIFVSLPLWSKNGSTPLQSLKMNAFGMTRQVTETQIIFTPTYYLVILAVLSVGISVFAIISFRNRVLQSALCATNSVVMTIIMGLVIYLTFYKFTQIFDPALPGKYDNGFYGLIAAMLANVFANRFIRRDEKMVQSAKRLR